MSINQASALGKVIVVGNQKGGVVKSQSSNEISYTFSRQALKLCA